MIRLLQMLEAKWNWFWFGSRSESDLVPLAIFRIFFCSVMLFLYLTRSLDVREWFTDSGYLPLWYRAGLDTYRFRPSLLVWFSDPWEVHALHWLFCGFLAMQLAGLFTRASAIGTYVLHLTFIHRDSAMMFGADTIATFFFLYLCFANTGARYSLDSVLKRNSSSQSTLSHIAFRLMQLQLCVIYAYAGLDKLQGGRWWDGSAFWDVLSQGHIQRFDMSFVAHFPVVLAIAAYAVLTWEIYFPLLVWLPQTRRWVLAFGVALHLGIFVFMNLPSFAFMMISYYVLFLKEDELKRMIEPFAARLQRH